MTVITIDVISDYTCAWCFISKRNLDAAAALYNKTYPNARTTDTFKKIYRPYYLNHPSNPINFPVSTPKSVVTEKKLGHLSQEKRDELKAKMDRIGKAVGLSFRYGGNIGPTQDAHRLAFVARACEGDVQDELAEGLLRANHEEERDISDRPTLREIALAAGMSEEQIDEAFESEDVMKAVDEEQEKYRAMAQGRGVPVYIIQGEHRIEGAQDISEFFETFIKVKEADVAAHSS